MLSFNGRSAVRSQVKGSELAKFSVLPSGPAIVAAGSVCIGTFGPSEGEYSLRAPTFKLI